MPLNSVVNCGQYLQLSEPWLFSAIDGLTDGVWTLYGGGGGMSQLKLVNQGASAMVREAPPESCCPCSCASRQCDKPVPAPLLGVRGSVVLWGGLSFPVLLVLSLLPGKPAETLIPNALALGEWALRLQPLCLLILSEE